MSVSLPLWLSLLSTSTTAAIAPERIALFELRASPELGALAKEMTDDLLVHLGRVPGVVAIGESEMQLLVAHEKDRIELGTSCDDDACLAKMNTIVRADKLITGHLGPWGSGFLCTLSLADVGMKSVERSESVAADDRTQLKTLITEAAERLLGVRARSEVEHVIEGLRAGTKIAVLDLASYGAPESVAGNLTQLLSLELRRVRDLKVISRDEIKAMIQYEAQKQILTCKDDVACLIEIGGALGVEFLVSGAVGKTEDTWIIHLKLLDVSKAEVASRVSQSFRGPTTELTAVLRHAVLALLGEPAQGAGAVAITTDAFSATVSIDGERPLALPLAEAISASSGKHALTLRAPGYLKLERDFYVDPSVLTRIDLQPQAAPVPWYREWWPWAIVGAAVVGGVTAAVIVANSDQASDPKTGSVHVGVR